MTITRSATANAEATKMSTHSSASMSSTSSPTSSTTTTSVATSVLLKSLLFIVVVGCCGSVAAFNLEARLPIVKLGVPGTYFGYSVAQHLTSNKSDSTKWWVTIFAGHISCSRIVSGYLLAIEQLYSAMSLHLAWGYNIWSVRECVCCFGNLQCHVRRLCALRTGFPCPRQDARLTYDVCTRHHT